MIGKVTILLSLALCVLGDDDDHHAISEQWIKIIHKVHHGHHGELSHIGSKEPEHHEEYASSYPSYEFSYKVHDPHTHDFKGQEESRDGDKVKGEYWLVEPDGRKRTVSYHADKHSGFHATVHYSDDHHHIENHHEEHHEEEHKKEEHKEEEEEKNDEKQGGGEEVRGEEQSNEAEGGNEEAADEGEEARGAEETRGPENEGKWIHDRHWGYHVDGRHRDQGLKHDHHENERRRDEYYPEQYYMVRGDGGHKRVQEHKDVGLGWYFPQHGYQNSELRAHKDQSGDEGKEESHLVQRQYNQQRATPLKKSGTVVRENYIHPRFYRHSESKLKA